MSLIAGEQTSAIGTNPSMINTAHALGTTNVDLMMRANRMDSRTTPHIYAVKYV